MPSRRSQGAATPPQDLPGRGQRQKRPSARAQAAARDHRVAGAGVRTPRTPTRCGAGGAGGAGAIGLPPQLPPLPPPRPYMSRAEAFARLNEVELPEYNRPGNNPVGLNLSRAQLTQ